MSLARVFAFELIGLINIERQLADEREPGLPLERTLRRLGLRRGVAFHNPAQLLQTMLNTRTPLVAFSGHVHHGSVLRIDRKSGMLLTAGMQASEDQHGMQFSSHRLH